MDEGSLAGIWFEPGSASEAALELVGTRHNVNAVEGSSGVYACGADSVLVDRCAFGLADSAETSFGRFVDCGRVVIDRVKLRHGVDKITASGVEALEVRDTEIAIYDLVDTNFFPRDSGAGDFAIVKAGAVSDADFPASPSEGIIGLDKANSRLYVRGPGDWGYVELGGGSLFRELVINGTGGSTAGWTATNGTLSVVSGRLRVTNTSVYGRAVQVVAVPESRYEFSVEITTGTALGQVRLGSTNGDASYGLLSASGTLTFTPLSSNVYVQLIANTETPGNYVDFDNISLRQT
jgi:hypothetical protein